MCINKETRIQLSANQSASVLGTDTVVLDYEAGNYFELNELGGVIWKLLQTHNTLSIQDLENYILAEFDVDPATCRQELIEFLSALSREKLIQLV